MRVILSLLFLLLSIGVFAQDDSRSQLLTTNQGLTIGGYGQVDYNQPFGGEELNNGVLDVHRLVLLFGYRFNERTSFVSEIEFEHVSEVYVEQAFLQYRINDYMNFRGGLLLIPMGIINEYHEPTSFNGVERPLIDKYIVPTTWREIGFGLQGTIIPASIRYQVYLVNGFKSYDDEAKLGGKSGLRGGRQKGAESMLTTPNVTARLEYFGLNGLKLGVSGYSGKTQSNLYDGIDKNDTGALLSADSSVVGVSMLAADAIYYKSGFTVKIQYYLGTISNTEQYNSFRSGTEMNDLGAGLNGYSAELAYNVFHSCENINTSLQPFLRYETFNTHHKVAEGLTANDDYQRFAITTGLSWKMAPGAVVKADILFLRNGNEDKYAKTFNAGVGFMF